MKYIKNRQTKLLAYLITTLLLASITIAASPPAIAISSPALSASHGNAGDTITVLGTDAQPGSQINIFWENANPTNRLTTFYAIGSGAYSGEINIPVVPAGAYYIIVQDFNGMAGSIFTIEPKITIAPALGIPNDTIHVSGTGFAANANITLNFGGAPFTTILQTITTDASGTFSATFSVPNQPYGSYNIYASDSINTASAPFTIGASIDIDKAQGSAGTVVTLTGRGFTATEGTNIAVTINSSELPVVLPIKTAADGTFTGQVIIPTLPAAPYQISTSDGTITASAPFNVTVTSGITLSPKTGAPGIQTVQISGNGFTAKAGTPVTVQIGPLILGTYTTDITGTFTGTFTAPTLFPAVYTVTAKDANGLVASTQFQTTLTALAVTPTTGATGATVTLTGFGFTGKTANITIDGTLLSAISVGDPQTSGTLLGGANFVVPTLPAGTYTITATDTDGLTAQTTLSITSTSTVTLNPTIASPDTTVNVATRWFEPYTMLTFTLKNATYSTDIYPAPSTGFGGTTTNATGDYMGTFVVPLTCNFGNYVLSITSAHGLTAEVPLTVSPMNIAVAPRQSQYAQGETGTFKVTSELNTPGSIVLTDPNGFTFDVLAVNLQKAGGAYTDPYITFRLPSDAPVGTWSWTADFTAYGGYTEAGHFTVVPAVSLPSAGIASSTKIGTSDDGTVQNDSPKTNYPIDTPSATDSNEVTNADKSQETSNSGASSSTDSTNAVVANKSSASTDPNTETQNEFIASSNVAETAIKTSTTTSSIATSIALTLLIAGSIASFAMLGLRYKCVPFSAVAQIITRCQKIIKRLVTGVANIKISL
ncbi:MAG: hypothetical protein LBQ98_02900 [Nitrososphaerota archaeon]|nr:hypothetical protein [Nitrososphaerota archaeon]